MLKKILKLSGVQKLNSLTQKEISGGGSFGGYLDGVDTTTDPDRFPSDPVTPSWRWRCHNQTSNGNTPTFFYSYTDLSYRGYICYPL
ncbi:hypothetical protein V1T75_02830 [Tenacibaculum sp. FZY0031]|uniref:hypothetical protein n=1 Tax=Tenacibaculum sp. FZY0031 TaxID=3116648 RepID=UPI002EA83262|nr:hypothetical protein [Tenacibaculum sp. FZY0031]